MTKRNQTVGKELRVLIALMLAGNMTASMCTNYYAGCMNQESYSRCPVYIVIHYSTDRTVIATTDSINNLVTLGGRITRGFLTASLCTNYYVGCVNHSYALILN